MNLTHTKYIIFLQKCAISIVMLINEKSREDVHSGKGAEARRRRKARRTTRVETIPFTGLFSQFPSTQKVLVMKK